MGADNTSNSINRKANEKSQANKLTKNIILANIKSKYIYKKVIDNIKKTKYLQIIKYSKIVQQILGLDINYFKDFSEKYTEVELEIIPCDNKYTKFINIVNEQDRAYYHIFFNDNKNEIKREYLDLIILMMNIH